MRRSLGAWDALGDGEGMGVQPTHPLPTTLKNTKKNDEDIQESIDTATRLHGSMVQYSFPLINIPP